MAFWPEGATEAEPMHMRLACLRLLAELCCCSLGASRQMSLYFGTERGPKHVKITWLWGEPSRWLFYICRSRTSPGAPTFKSCLSVAYDFLPIIF